MDKTRTIIFTFSSVVVCLSGFDFSKSCSELCCFCLTCWSLAESNACSAKCYLALLHGILGYAHEVPALHTLSFGLLSVRTEISLEFLNFSIAPGPEICFLGRYRVRVFVIEAKKKRDAGIRFFIYLTFDRYQNLLCMDVDCF